MDIRILRVYPFSRKGIRISYCILTILLLNSIQIIESNPNPAYAPNQVHSSVMRMLLFFISS